MIKREWKSLLKNKILIVVLIAIIAIPFIYAGLFLKSMWDPYGNLDKLPVAVVNEDRPVEYEGNTLSIGDDLTDALKENDSLDFHFVDRSEAQEGLKDGTWYMVITIPEDFSGNAATLLDDSPRKMQLDYETNPGTNYIASKMSETALTQIRDEISTQVTETYTGIVFDRIAQAGSKVAEAADGSLELESGILEASDGSRTITENLKKLSDSTLTFSGGAGTFTKGLREYTDGVSRAGTGAAQLKEGTDLTGSYNYSGENGYSASLSREEYFPTEQYDTRVYGSEQHAWQKGANHRASVDVSVDKAPDGMREVIAKIIRQTDGVEKWHALRVRSAGAEYEVDVNIHVKRNLSIVEAHEIAENVENRMKERLGKKALINVHVEPDD